MRLEPIHDPEGDRIAALDRLDREIEKAGWDWSPVKPCSDCGLMPKELVPGFWLCACNLGAKR